MVVIRADGNEHIGAGHIMRCLSIAEEIKKNDKCIVFVMAEEKFESLVKERGFETFVLHSDYSDMSSEEEMVIEYTKKIKPTALIVDSYFVTPHYLEKLRKITKLIYIDDRMEFAYDVDMIINYNVFAREDSYVKLYGNCDRKKPQLLLGTSYAPLRKQFLNSRITIKENVSDILVLSGATDKQHVEKGLMEWLIQEKNMLEKYRFHFVAGKLNSDYENLKKLAVKDNNLCIHYDVNDMKSLMCLCDVAVSAAGSTLYELCACGIPAITYSFADNQMPAEHEFANRKIMLSVGDIRDNIRYLEQIMQCLEHLINDYKMRSDMSAKAFELVDGKGAGRIAEYIFKKQKFI